MRILRESPTTLRSNGYKLLWYAYEDMEDKKLPMDKLAYELFPTPDTDIELYYKFIKEAGSNTDIKDMNNATTREQIESIVEEIAEREGLYLGQSPSQYFMITTNGTDEIYEYPMHSNFESVSEFIKHYSRVLDQLNIKMLVKSRPYTQTIIKVRSDNNSSFKRPNLKFINGPINWQNSLGLIMKELGQLK